MRIEIVIAIPAPPSATSDGTMSFPREPAVIPPGWNAALGIGTISLAALSQQWNPTSASHQLLLLIPKPSAASHKGGRLSSCLDLHLMLPAFYLRRQVAAVRVDVGGHTASRSRHRAPRSAPIPAPRAREVADPSGSAATRSPWCLCGFLHAQGGRVSAVRHGNA